VKLFIPWHLFFEALAKQPKSYRQRWLGLWLFDDYGVTVRPELSGWQEVPPALRDAFALLNIQEETTIH
jgi:hypothetical protein